MINPDKITIHASATLPLAKYGFKFINEEHRKRFGTKYRCKETGAYCGYMWIILPDGTIEKGRSETSIGVHVKGHNTGNIGICLVGGINKTGKAENNFTEAQWDSLRELVTDIIGRWGIKHSNIKGHRDYSPDLNKDGKITRNEWVKECPCFDVKNWLDSLGE